MASPNGATANGTPTNGTSANGAPINGTAPDHPPTPDSTTASEGEEEEEEEEEEEPALLSTPPFTYRVFFPLEGKNKDSISKKEFLDLACADLQENKIQVTLLHREPTGYDVTGATMFVLLAEEDEAEARRMAHTSIQIAVDSFIGENQVIRSPDDVAAEAQLRADLEEAANGSDGHGSSDISLD